MNNIFAKSLLVLAMVSQGAVASIDTSQEECNSSEGLGGWAVWCGVDTYLTQQEPTAAGPVEGGVAGLTIPGVETDDFGGDIVPPAATTPEVTPPEVTPPTVEPEIVYNWTGYAALSHVDLGVLETGELKLKVDPDTGVVLAVLTTSLGTEIAFDQNSRFYGDGEGLPIPQEVLDSLSIVDPSAGGSPVSQFSLTSADGSMRLVTFPQTWGVPGDNGDVAAFGAIVTENGVDYFAAGSPTPLSNMADLVAGNVTAFYAGSGVYSGFGQVDNTMTVNFGNSTWEGTWGDALEIDPAELSFNATGTVTGNKFASNEGGIKYGDKNPFVNTEIVYEGTIKGSFNGANASSLTGVIDIIHTGDQQVVGAFINTKIVPPPAPN